MGKQEIIGNVLIIIFFIACALLGTLFLFADPYKEVCTCTKTSCSVVSYYFDYTPYTNNIPKSSVKFVVSGRGRKHGPIYYIKPIFENSYYLRFRAEADYNKIISPEESKITKWNIFLPAILILLGSPLPISVIKNGL